MSKKSNCALVGLIALGTAYSMQAVAETATWQGATGGDWETAGNWDTRAVPGPTTNVKFSTNTSMKVNVSSVLPTFDTMMVAGKGVNFALGSSAKMTSASAVTNYNTASYSGGTYSFGGDLVVGRSNKWPGSTWSYSTKAFFDNCEAEVTGRIVVSGYRSNGLNVQKGAYVKSAGYIDRDGTRNVTEIKGVYHSTGKISIYDSWPVDGNTGTWYYPFTVDGGVVTNEGTFVLAEGNAGSVPVFLKNGAYWRQFGETTIGARNSNNSLQVLSGSTYDSTGDIKIGPLAGANLKDSLIVDGGSTVKAANIDSGAANRASNCWVHVTGGSTLACSGAYKLGASYAAGRHSLVVADGSTFSANAFMVGAGKSVAGDLHIAVSNSTFTVANSFAIPFDVTCKDADFTLYGTEVAPATARFADGIVIGAGIIGTDVTTERTIPTVFTVDGGLLDVGRVVDGASSGPLRLGGLTIGVQDKATNRLVVAGKTGCVVVRHAMMTDGNPAVEFQVPENGYQNDGYLGLPGDSGFYANKAYLRDAKIIIDITRVAHDTEWKEYVLARSPTWEGLIIDTSKIEVVAPSDGKCKYQVVYENPKSHTAEKKLSVKVRYYKGLMLLVR